MSDPPATTTTTPAPTTLAQGAAGTAAPAMQVEVDEALRAERERAAMAKLSARYKVLPAVFDDRTIVGKKVTRTIPGWRSSPFWGALVAVVLGIAAPSAEPFDKVEAQRAFSVALDQVCDKLPELLEDHTERAILPSTLQRVYEAIVRWAQEDGLAWVSMERLAKDLKYDVRTVRRAVRTLEQLGALGTFQRWLETDREPFSPGYRTNVYLPFNPQVLNWGEERPALTEGSASTPPESRKPTESSSPTRRAPRLSEASPGLQAQLTELTPDGEDLASAIEAQLKVLPLLHHLVARADELALYCENYEKGSERNPIPRSLALKGLRELQSKAAAKKFPPSFEAAKAFMRDAQPDPPGARPSVALPAEDVLTPEELAERRRLQAERLRKEDERLAREHEELIVRRRHFVQSGPVFVAPPSVSRATHSGGDEGDGRPPDS